MNAENREKLSPSEDNSYLSRYFRFVRAMFLVPLIGALAAGCVTGIAWGLLKPPCYAEICLLPAHWVQIRTQFNWANPSEYALLSANAAALSIFFSVLKPPRKYAKTLAGYHEASWQSLLAWAPILGIVSGAAMFFLFLTTNQKAGISYTQEQLCQKVRFMFVDRKTPYPEPDPATALAVFSKTFPDRNGKDFMTFKYIGMLGAGLSLWYIWRIWLWRVLAASISQEQNEYGGIEQLPGNRRCHINEFGSPKIAVPEDDPEFNSKHTS